MNLFSSNDDFTGLMLFIAILFVLFSSNESFDSMNSLLLFFLLIILLFGTKLINKTDCGCLNSSCGTC